MIRSISNRALSIFLSISSSKDLAAPPAEVCAVLAALKDHGWSDNIVQASVYGQELQKESARPKYFEEMALVTPKENIVHVFFHSPVMGYICISIFKNINSGLLVAFVRTKYGRRVIEKDGLEFDCSAAHARGLAFRLLYSYLEHLVNVVKIPSIDFDLKDYEKFMLGSCNASTVVVGDPELFEGLSHIDSSFQNYVSQQYLVDFLFDHDIEKNIELWQSTISKLMIYEADSLIAPSRLESSVFLRELGLVAKTNGINHASTVSRDTPKIEKIKIVDSFGATTKIIEFLRTEALFVQNLRNMDIFFNQPLKNIQSVTGVSNYVAKGIIVELAEVLAVHQFLYDEMNAIYERKGDNMLRDIMKVFTSRLESLRKPHIKYNLGLTSSRIMFNNIKDSKNLKSFNHFLNKCQEEACSKSGKNLSFNDLKIMPLQRLSGYVILMNQILENTSESNMDDYNACLTANLKVKEIMRSVDHAISLESSRDLLFNMSKKLELEEIIKPDSRFICDLEVKEVIDGVQTTQDVTLVLFNGLILVLKRNTPKVVKVTGSVYVCESKIPLFGVTIIEITEFEFVLMVRDNGQEIQVYKFIASVSDLKRSFVRKLNNCLMINSYHGGPSKLFAERYSDIDVYFRVTPSRLYTPDSKHNFMCVVHQEGEDISQFLSRFKSTHPIIAVIIVNSEGKFRYTIKCQNSNSAKESTTMHAPSKTYESVDEIKGDLLLSIRNANEMKKSEIDYISKADQVVLDSYLAYLLEPKIPKKDETAPVETPGSLISSLFSFLSRTKSQKVVPKTRFRVYTACDDSPSVKSSSNSTSMMNESLKQPGIRPQQGIPRAVGMRQTRTSPQKSLKVKSLIASVTGSASGSITRKPSIIRTLKQSAADFKYKYVLGKIAPASVVMRLLELIEAKGDLDYDTYCSTAENVSQLKKLAGDLSLRPEETLKSFRLLDQYTVANVFKRYIYHEAQGYALIPESVKHNILQLSEEGKLDSELAPAFKFFFNGSQTTDIQLLALRKLFSQLKIIVAGDCRSGLDKLLDSLAVTLLLPIGAYAAKASNAKRALDVIIFNYDVIFGEEGMGSSAVSLPDVSDFGDKLVDAVDDQSKVEGKSVNRDKYMDLYMPSRYSNSPISKSHRPVSRRVSSLGCIVELPEEGSDDMGLSNDVPPESDDDLIDSPLMSKCVMRDSKMCDILPAITNLDTADCVDVGVLEDKECDDSSILSTAEPEHDDCVELDFDEVGNETVLNGMINGDLHVVTGGHIEDNLIENEELDNNLGSVQAFGGNEGTQDVKVVIDANDCVLLAKLNDDIECNNGHLDDGSNGYAETQLINESLSPNVPWTRMTQYRSSLEIINEEEEAESNMDIYTDLSVDPLGPGYISRLKRVDLMRLGHTRADVRLISEQVRHFKESGGSFGDSNLQTGDLVDDSGYTCDLTESKDRMECLSIDSKENGLEKNGKWSARLTEDNETRDSEVTLTESLQLLKLKSSYSAGSMDKFASYLNFSLDNVVARNE